MAPPRPASGGGGGGVGGGGVGARGRRRLPLIAASAAAATLLLLLFAAAPSHAAAAAAPISADAAALEPLRDLVQRSGRAVAGWNAQTDPCARGGGDCDAPGEPARLASFSPRQQQPLPACAWSGVSCRGGRVVAVDLSCEPTPGPGAGQQQGPLCVYTPLSADPLDSAGLARDLPRLSELRALSLRGAGLRGSLPEAWASPGSFPRLEALDLADNALSGPVPLAWWLPQSALSRPPPPPVGGGGGVFPFFSDGTNRNHPRQTQPTLPPPASSPLQPRGLASLRVLDVSGNCALCGDDPFPAGPALVNTRGTAIPLDCARVSPPQGVGGVGAGLGSGGAGCAGRRGVGGDDGAHRVLMNIIASVGVIAVAIALGVCQQRLCPWLCCAGGTGGGGEGAAYVDARWACCWRVRRAFGGGRSGGPPFARGQAAGRPGGAAAPATLPAGRQGATGRAAAIAAAAAAAAPPPPPPVKFFEAVVELWPPPPEPAMNNKAFPAAAGDVEMGRGRQDGADAAAAAGPSASSAAASAGAGWRARASAWMWPDADAADAAAGDADAADSADADDPAPPPPPPADAERAPPPPPPSPLRTPAASAAATPSSRRRRRSSSGAQSAAASPPAREPSPPTVVVLPDHGIALMQRCDDDDDEEESESDGEGDNKNPTPTTR